MNNLLTILAASLLVIVGCIVLSIVCAIPVWLLWNWVAVTVLGLKAITLFQALGLCLLSSLLFKSSGSSKS